MRQILSFRKGAPLARRTLFAVLAAIYTVAVLVVVAADTQLVPPDMLVWFAILAWMAPFLAVVPFLNQAETRWGWMTVVLLFGGVVVAVPAFTAQQSILAAQGVPLAATIVDAREMSDYYLLYTIRTTSGAPVPGLLEAQNDYTVGDRVEVIVHPSGLVHPMLAEDLEGTTPWTGLGVFAPVFGLHLVFCWLAAKPSGRSRRDLPSTVEDIPWVPIGIGTFFIALSLLLLVLPGISELDLSRNGIQGTVDVAQCSPRYDDRGVAESWSCTGSFVSQDGRLRIEQVTIEPEPAERLNGSVMAKVAGADSTYAYTETDWEGLLLSGGAMCAIGVWWIVLGFRKRIAAEASNWR